ncbi:MAG: PIN domain-containing protein [Proteobacteria bacterium]|nr:PIN domain-containing protein [Pseudomonadota bacterium]
MDSEIVIDASVALCYLRRERGWEGVPQHLPIASMSVVNYAEVFQRLLRESADAGPRAQLLIDMGLRLIDADPVLARAAAELEAPTRGQGISLADRFCIALAMLRQVPLLTADKPWAALGLGIDIRLLR